MAATVCGPGEGERLSDTRLYVIKAAQPELGLFDSVLKSGEGTSPHIHRQHADAFYVLEGELEVMVGTRTARLGSGGLVLAPPGVTHAVRNPGPGPERHLNLHAPGEPFVALARARARGEDVDPADFDVFAPEPGGEGVVSGPGEGELQGEHSDHLVKAALPQLSVLEVEVGPGYQDPGLQYHQQHVESFYVLEGELEFTLDGEKAHANEGTSVTVPPGTLHAFSNPGPGRARLLNVHAPDSGFVEYLRARSKQIDPAEYDIYNVYG